MKTGFVQSNLVGKYGSLLEIHCVTKRGRSLAVLLNDDHCKLVKNTETFKEETITQNQVKDLLHLSSIRKGITKSSVKGFEYFSLQAKREELKDNGEVFYVTQHFQKAYTYGYQVMMINNGVKNVTQMFKDFGSSMSNGMLLGDANFLDYLKEDGYKVEYVR